MQAYSLSRIVHDARQLTRSIHVSLAEMLFVFSHSQLNEVEKLLWLTLAAHAERDSLSCTLSYAQLSHCIYQPHENVHRALKRLSALGFLEIEGLPEVFTPLALLATHRFGLALPLEGLLALKKTSCSIGTVTKDKPRRPVTINLLHAHLQRQL